LESSVIRKPYYNHVRLVLLIEFRFLAKLDQVKISIIIPTLNEADFIGALITKLIEQSGDREIEIIVADAESKDGTANLAKAAGAKVIIMSACCRAKQMNAGAKIAEGEILYFVHADLVPPGSFFDDILTAVENGHRYGCYQVTFDRPVPGLKFNSSLSKYQGIFFRGGDQTLYMTRDFFDLIGGFDDAIVIMEDYEILLRARKHEKIHIMDEKVIISARKMETNHYFKTNVINVLVFVLFFLGASQKTLVNIYQKYVKGAKYKLEENREMPS
jgi:rSAM/selenodomain-associated transferase 2